MIAPRMFEAGNGGSIVNISSLVSSHISKKYYLGSPHMRMLNSVCN